VAILSFGAQRVPQIAARQARAIIALIGALIGALIDALVDALIDSDWAYGCPG